MSPSDRLLTLPFRTPSGALAYTDVGSGAPIVFLHGNPTSALLYRHLLHALSPEYRCVAPDLLGFGRSEAPTDASYRPPVHATRIEALLRHLDLPPVTLVLHDWGGPIGLAYALRHPAAVRRLVLLNTWAWPLTHRPLLWAFSRLVDTGPGRLAIEQLNAFPTVLMPATTGPSSPFHPDWIRRYAAALDTRERRRACWAFARALRTETPWLRALWTHRHRLQNCPMLLCWGMADPAFGTDPCLRRWMDFAPHAVVHRFPEIGHYVPEELGPALVPPILNFLRSSSR